VREATKGKLKRKGALLGKGTGRKRDGATGTTEPPNKNAKGRRHWGFGRRVEDLTLIKNRTQGKMIAGGNGV